jgi:hypothetical protein
LWDRTGTRTAGTLTLCLGGTGTVSGAGFGSGSGAGAGSGSDKKWDKKVKKINNKESSFLGNNVASLN